MHCVNNKFAKQFVIVIIINNVFDSLSNVFVLHDIDSKKTNIFFNIDITIAILFRERFFVSFTAIAN